MDAVAATNQEEVEEEITSETEVEEHTTTTSTFSQEKIPRII